MKKFIITKDESRATKLLTCGFQLVSHTCGVWTFMNMPPQNFSFTEIDNKTYSYSNNLFL
jgi:hypothetical protein